MILKIITILLLAAICSCSSIASIFDDAKLIWSTERSVEEAITLANFVVGINEVKSLIEPKQKFHWYIYADSSSYYIVETQTLVLGFYINSNMARKSGIAIYAKSRDAYEFALNSLGQKKHYSFHQLRSILKSRT